MFKLSHDDIRCALYSLIAVYDEADNDWYSIREVFDDYFIMQNWCGEKLYKQAYDVDGDNVSLNGDRVEVFEMILTESEKMAIEKMRGDYAELEAKYNELKEFKDNYDASVIKAQKDEIFAKEEYSILSENEDFKNLVNDAANFSVEEVASKAKSIFADYVIATGEFSAKSEKKLGAMKFNVNTVDNTNEKPYGNLFD